MRFCRIFIALCLACSFLIPNRVYAEGASYTLLSAGCYNFGQSTGNNLYNTYAFSEDVRAIALIDSNNYVRFYFYKNAPFNRNATTERFQYGACPVSLSPALADNANTGYYYYASITLKNYNLNGIVSYTDNFSTDTERKAFAFSVTYGNAVIDPTPPTPTPTPLPNYGDLVDVRFNTSIAGSGDASINNIDNITWNPDHDSNEIMFDGSESVQIRAIAGNYTSSTRNGLLAGTVTDFDYNSSVEHMLAEYPVTRGYYDVTWSHVIEQLHAGSISDFLQIRKSNDVWLKSGWIYQIRLVADEYTGQWITIYNGTSSGVQNSLNIENSTEINTTLINTIQQINNLNNSIDEDWTINNITINMENSDGTTTTDKPWWAYLLEAIVSLCSGILSFLGGLIGDLIDAILGLFQPAEFTINNYNEFKIELKENSGIFGQSFDFISTLKDTFLGVEYEEPIIHWSGIYFGEVALIPEADYNLNDYVTMWGLSDFRQIAYLCTDGFIYLSILVLIMRKLNEVLKK